jgi:3-deoxy-manno-octulosonate cytidylyltransferase (CMP-KDO synthetase)
MNIAIVLPARLHSTRLSEKMLADIHGKPLIVRTYEQALHSELCQNVLVATDNQKILDELTRHGCKAVLTPETIQTGSDRIAYVVGDMDMDVVINVQGDEPLIPPKMIDAAIEPFLSDASTLCTTLVKRMAMDDPDIQNPNVVKVAVDQEMNALYFSRSPIPYARHIPEDFYYYRHIGLYGYKKDVLMAFSKWAKSKLEQVESLEQLRLLEHGINIKCVETSLSSQAVDTPEDLEKVRALYKA